MTTNISLLLTRASLISGIHNIIYNEYSKAKYSNRNFFSLNQRTDNVTWGKLRLKSAQNKEREKTLRLSNKYDFKHLNYYEESSEYFTEETIEAPENGSSSDEARNIETVQNMQDFQQQVAIRQMKTSESVGELEELNKTVNMIFLRFHFIRILILGSSTYPDAG